ncbi:MAG: hypothetical protein JSU07_00470 [Bacteroidetes bacterium]|nr:hypothetical protein [Bacteroidota bacterium]
MKNSIKVFALLTVLFVFVSCKKDQTSVQQNPNSSNNTGNTSPQGNAIKVSFNHTSGTNPLLLNTKYVNANGDTFQITTLKYYISNVVFTNTNSTTFAESKSYHLIDITNPASTQFTIGSIPSGQYSAITFMLGVDSTHNVSGSQAGALDPVNGMFWTWNTGYVMFKCEGKSPVVPAYLGQYYNHLGGFSGPNKIQRTLTFSFTPTSINANVTASASSTVNINADILRYYSVPNVISINTYSDVTMPGARAATLADNAAGMLKFTSVQNQ